jgi:hypothetical protein
MSAINEELTFLKQQQFGNTKRWNEDRVAREYGATALDHFRAIRYHRDQLKNIIKNE